MADVNTALIDSYLQTLWDREGHGRADRRRRRRR